MRLDTRPVVAEDDDLLGQQQALFHVMGPQQDSHTCVAGHLLLI